MSLDRVKKLLQQKEGIHLEYKKAKNGLPNNLFESICAMLNRDGGDIILGVEDNGNILGLDETKIENYITNIVNASNNKEKLSPSNILFPQWYKIDGKTIIHISIPVSSQIHKTNNIVFDRSNDGDFKVSEPERISQLVLSKRQYFSELKVYPYVSFEDFEPGIFDKVRDLIKINNRNHPWLHLTDEQMLKMAGLWRVDSYTQHEGYTLAAILLFGSEILIKNVLPYYKVDAILRRDNIYRYDDRDYIECNLICAYDRVMNFIAKHLPDPFYMEGDQRQSIRTKIFREVVANILIHREYTDASPTILVIHKDRVETQNANVPKGKGNITLNNFVPFLKTR